MVAIPALSRCTIPDSTNTSASWAIISPKKVILLEKTNIITAGVFAANHAINAVSSRPTVIQPYTCAM
ncbi:hypothetical protein MAKP2_18620 [Klebsiella pneumoniae subsp. pneumoniae]|uniref:Uncharacterized protein n=1 Tax=Klebsiella pneumoniae TaxID=573 RepID=A0A377UXJ7_KLEPN|nr:hypothetical protein [Klebsiella sp. SORGH_AS_1173]GFM45560.1 hypothetical protein MAKP2_18620 [Klebsiella pneumoniae subsp. pneumoniae]STT02334.1 Uncharacterised protein [Klebsiella pneumoniae]